MDDDDQQYHFERALFVVGEQNAGKSTQLRSMFRDVRLGTKGVVPPPQNLSEIYRFSNERSLYLRITSPHERGEYLTGPSDGEEGINFIDKTDQKLSTNTPNHGRRWNFACPLQPFAFRNMPGVVKVVQKFVDEFNPERTRVIFLSPDRHDAVLQGDHSGFAQALQKISSVEVAWIDARERVTNGLLIADFFDFT